MISKINSNNLPDVRKDSSSGQSGRLRTSDNNKADASLQISYGTIIEKAGQEPIEDTNKVERARQLLLSGELDSPENIRKAAENILKFGI